MENVVIGIEGLVGSGKTSICRQLIKEIPNTVLLNGSNLYRAIVYAMMKNGKKLEDVKKQGKGLDIKEMMDLFKIQIRIEDSETIIYIDNEIVSEKELQSKESSIAVSTVGGKANNENLFIFARNFIDELKSKNNVIISGRSIMQIYPDTDYHFFITADLEERIRRKCIQYGNNESREEIKNNIINRDKLQENAGFYKLSKNTIEIDVTDCKSLEESTNLVMERIGKKWII